MDIPQTLIDDAVSNNVQLGDVYKNRVVGRRWHDT